jgi:hypothetical protein
MSPSVVGTMPDIQDLITEDDTPVDNLPSEKQQRLLTEPLYSAWAGPGKGARFSRRPMWAFSIRRAIQPSCQTCF